jgi:benzylsuccinate CoA-transferase BbsF subunit
MSYHGPLSGIRVLDFTWVGAGPLTTRFLADFGAEVIKIESVTRPDPLRVTPPLARGESELERSGYFASRNANKKSFALDMAKPQARQVALDLAAHSDICAQSFRPGTMEKWRLGYETLKTVRPDIIYLAMPMQGEWGPHATFSGFGATLIALSGLHELCGDPDRPPVGTGTNYPDHVPNPMHAATAVLAALLHRRRTGAGQRIEISQLESTLNVIGPTLEQAFEGRMPSRSGNRVPHACPHGVYPTRGDDSWIAITAMDDRQWQGLTEVAGDALARFTDLTVLSARKARENELDRALSAWTRSQDGAELARRLRSSGVPAAVLRTARDLLDTDNELRDRGAFVWLDHPVMGVSVYNSPTPRLDRTPGSVRTSAPLLGADTEQVCRDLLGYPNDKIESLRASGVLRL